MLDLDWTLVTREIARASQSRRPGPAALNLLRDAGPSMRRIA